MKNIYLILFLFMDKVKESFIILHLNMKLERNNVWILKWKIFMLLGLGAVLFLWGCQSQTDTVSEQAADETTNQTTDQTTQ